MSHLTKIFTTAHYRMFKHSLSIGLLSLLTLIAPAYADNYLTITPTEAQQLGIDITQEASDELAVGELTTFKVTLPSTLCALQSASLTIMQDTPDIFDSNRQKFAQVWFAKNQQVFDFSIRETEIKDANLNLTCATGNINGSEQVRVVLMDSKEACELRDGKRNARRSVKSSGRSNSESVNCTE